MRIARSVTRLYWMTIFQLKRPLHSHCRVPSDFFVHTPQKIAQNRLVFCAFHQRNKVTDEPCSLATQRIRGFPERKCFRLHGCQRLPKELVLCCRNGIICHLELSWSFPQHIPSIYGKRVHYCHSTRTMKNTRFSHCFLYVSFCSAKYGIGRNGPYRIDCSLSILLVEQYLPASIRSISKKSYH